MFHVHVPSSHLWSPFPQTCVSGPLLRMAYPSSLRYIMYIFFCTLSQDICESCNRVCVHAYAHLSNWIPKHAGALCSIDGHCEFEGVVRDVRCVSPMPKREVKAQGKEGEVGWLCVSH